MDHFLPVFRSYRVVLPAIFVFFSFLLQGCAGLPAEPVRDRLTATPGASPTEKEADLPPTVLATVTMTLPPSATPPAFPVMRIKNAESGAFLADVGGIATLISDPASEAALWVVETYQGSKRLQNRASGNYLHIENLKANPEVTAIEAVWMSPRWVFDGDPAEGSIVIRNVWHNWQVLYMKDGQVAYERVPTDADNARWLLESADGVALAANTPTPMVVIPTPQNPPDSRGAIVPWVEYAAETGQTNGEILTPDRAFGTIASESVGRSAVKLTNVGEYAQFQTTAAANSVVVRYVIPDSEDGKGLEATISLYVNDVFRQKIKLTSKYAWSYGGEEETYNIPKMGGAHHFYDEARALVGDLPAGATVKLQKDADDTADYYVIDLVDLEQVAAPLEKPEGYISITECGALADSDQDAGDAIQQCIDKARAAKTGVWIPVGVFKSEIHGFDVAEVTIQGAGMWYSTIQGFYARFNCTGNNCQFRDFAILGETLHRDDKSPENGFNGSAGSGSLLENIWVEHTKVGFWVSGGTNGLVIRNSRFRNLFADGINFCNGTSYSVVENSHFRNTGDDALASWSPKGDPVNIGNAFRFNTIQVPWRANCLAIYGGKDNRIENNLCYDVVTYPGIFIAQQFGSNPFEGTTVVARNSIIRGGGPMFGLQHGALKIWAQQGDITGLQVSDLLIDSPTFAGLELVGGYAITAAVFEHIEIRDAGTNGIYLNSNLSGDASFSFITVKNSAKENVVNYAPKLKFKLTLGGGLSGWQLP